MMYLMERVSCGTEENGLRWMRLLCWQQLDDGEMLVLDEEARHDAFVWRGRRLQNADCGEDAAPLADMQAIAGSQELRELAWREGAVEFAVERHPDMGKAEIFVQAKLAI